MSMPIEQLRRPRRGASAAILAYFRSELRRQEARDGARVPSVRAVAKHFGVSNATVQRVFRELKRDAVIRTEIGRGTFFAAAAKSSLHRLRIAFNIPPKLDPHETWGSRINEEILRAASLLEQPLDLQPFPAHQFEESVAAEALEQHLGPVDGVLLYATERAEAIVDYCGRNGKPIVSINPPRVGVTVDFVSPDYFDASLRIGRAWRETGRRNIVFLDQAGFENRASSLLRWAGLSSGLGGEFLRGANASVQVVEAKSSLEEHGYEAMRRYLKTTTRRPDAVYCAGDPIALGALAALRDAGLAVPRNVSVIGGTGLTLPNCPGLTRMAQPFRELAVTLLHLIAERVRLNNASLPGRFLPMIFLGGTTTRRAENERLGIPNARAASAGQGSVRRSICAHSNPRRDSR
jgi:DNA-binding LacI/PurR family transcriptional regulator